LSPKPGSVASSTGYVPSLQDDRDSTSATGDFNLARAAGELAETWFDTLTGKPSPARPGESRTIGNGPVIGSATQSDLTKQRHMF
jgi:hypothetical protein